MPKVQSENWVNISETNLDKKEDASGNGNSKSNATPADEDIDAHKSSVCESPEEKKSPHIKDFNDMLQAVGSWGRFQIGLTIFFFPFNLFLGYVYLSSILINFAPPHWCKVNELMNLSMDTRINLSIPKDKDGYSKCTVYHTNWEQVLEEGLTEPDPTWTQIACYDGWEYDIENYHRTIVTDFDWVCDDAWIPAFSQAMFFIGAIPGTLGFGYMSDHYGRVPATLVSNMLAMVSGLVTPFTTNMASFLTLRFITGMSLQAFFQQPYILALEYVDESKRTLVGNLGLALFLTISGIYQPWLIKGVGDWKPFSWIIFSQMALAAAVPWVMPESSRWLMSQGKSDKAVEVMRRIARINKKEVPEEVFESFRTLCTKEQEAEGSENKKKNLTFLDLFRHKNLRKITILIIILWMVTALVFDSTVRNVENLNFSIYISFMISTGLELPADLLSIIGLEYMGRRWSAFLSLGLAGLFMLLTIPALGNVWVAGVLSMMGRFCATYAMNTGFQFTVEVMPTELRGQGTALASIMSMAAQIASPYIVFSASIDPTLPFYLIGVLGILGAIPGLFLPETAGTNLPDTIEETHQYGRLDNFFWFPLMGPKRRYKISKEVGGKVISSENKAYMKTNLEENIPEEQSEEKPDESGKNMQDKSNENAQNKSAETVQNKSAETVQNKSAETVQIKSA
ncbi:solute carrier family 22 member 5 isoform X4 [Eurytemora carolleeae]|uniref:solute carrier family 22 member 5 isoform X4 n=1 Tax=Eurytemora carolleeae TaxID=1294199 RepID=UPI000C78F0E5|nr:solute carrier family 22 member 5 isoform X4 [Eurytemora carolleeae]|eukprot:XP_023327758.1 solute carrier family 22 member 5-like isoform X4 [Eurytemora affinis]